MPQFS